MNKEVQYEYIINNCIETCNYIGEFVVKVMGVNVID